MIFRVDYFFLEKKSIVDEAQKRKQPGPVTVARVSKGAQVQEKAKSVVDYEVYVKTSDEMGAGTDSNVFISLFGDKTELVNMQLKNPERKDLFEKNALDVFVLDKQIDIGKVRFKQFISQKSLFIVQLIYFCLILFLAQEDQNRSRWQKQRLFLETRLCKSLLQQHSL